MCVLYWHGITGACVCYSDMPSNKLENKKTGAHVLSSLSMFFFGGVFFSSEIAKKERKEQTKERKKCDKLTTKEDKK